ncbi:uncharacterized protein BP5553_07897 [Venustampulla echinocandica]|uniref:LysM domain-containing protein n=1 Tax=Venustampulla echinocandica TaxID=2656787 RepID=A0A370THU4_9HELO|nr:uncharacterized protein BP5553_07897 [Venustampulla echinocandica]RDL34769.1 hypothetical protein BP5553_07897 [Venustampulla echinocandica]
MALRGACVKILPSEQLSTPCESSCIAALQKLRTSISGACTKSLDVMVLNSVAYPPTFLADRYLHTSSLSCLKDNYTDTSYCVKAVGSIASYPGYKTSTLVTTFACPATATVFVPSPVATATLNPTTSGTTINYYLYENTFDATLRSTDLAVANSYDDWAQYTDVTFQELIEWNPSLQLGYYVLQFGNSYYIQKW